MWEHVEGTLDHVTSHVIDLIEAAYDLEKPDSDWLPSLLDAGGPILDHGLGVAADEFTLTPRSEGADIAIHTMHLRSLPPDFPARVAESMVGLSPEVIASLNSHGLATTLSDASKGYAAEVAGALRILGYADLLGMLAIDPSGAGVRIVAPLSEVTRLTPKRRERWQMLGAHIAAAYRLRRALTAEGGQPRIDSTELPHEAEAILDANGFRIVESAGRAQEANASAALRRAARRVDRARGKLREADPGRALMSWKALVSGRWSIVDWFDSDGRRFVLAMPNPPGLQDPRGLTMQERQVVRYVLLGETNKLIAYSLGLSPGRVSGLLKSAMRKRGVTTRTQLVEKLHPLGVPPGGNGDDQSSDN